MGVIGFILYKFISNRGNQGSMNSSQNKKYKAAVKQSQEKYGSQKGARKAQLSNFKKSARDRKRNPSRNHKHLTVIDGAKSNKNSRASQ